MFIFLLPI